MTDGYFVYVCKSVCVLGTCSMICRMVFNRTTPEDFSEPASFGSVSTIKTQDNSSLMKILTHKHRTEQEEAGRHSLAIANRSGISEASFSFAASAMAPNSTTGRRKPAATTHCFYTHTQRHRFGSTEVLN